MPLDRPDQRSPATQVDASIPQLSPDGYPPAAAAPWARAALAASVRRDDEPSSSSIYAAAQPPAALAAANFSAFVNGEPLRGQDVVAWVTVGAWDLPSAESAPALATPGRRCSPAGLAGLGSGNPVIRQRFGA